MDSHNESLTQTLSRALSQEVHECAICIDPILQKQQIWSCSVCYGVMHLPCVNRWAIAQVEASSSKHIHHLRTNVVEYSWKCPLCMSECNDPLPLVSRCYCGSQMIQEVNSNKTHQHHHRHHQQLQQQQQQHDRKEFKGHSCMQACQRRKKCGHLCIHECHPGPCPSCDTVLIKSCHCGRTSVQVKCGDEEKGSQSDQINGSEKQSTSWACCDQVCDKVLICGRHRCTTVCHSGSCKRCNQKFEQMCFCGKKREVRFCPKNQHACVDRDTNLLRSFCCKTVCGKQLQCGHVCRRLCHSDPCVRGQARSLELLSEYDTEQTVVDHDHAADSQRIPGCKIICDRIRSKCGHKCGHRCHPNESNCNKLHCEQYVEVFCDCERRSCSVRCSLFESKQRIASLFVQCDETCHKIKHIKEMAASRNGTVPVLPQYSADLLSFGKLNLKFIHEIESVFDKIVVNSLDSYPFDPMPLWKRMFLYEYASHFELEHYGIKSISASLNIPCVYRKDTSHVPLLLLSDFVTESEEYLIAQEQVKLAKKQKKQETLDNYARTKREKVSITIQPTDHTYKKNSKKDELWIRRNNVPKTPPPEEHSTFNVWTLLQE